MSAAETVLRALRASDLDELVEVQRRGAVEALASVFPQETHPFPTAAIRASWADELADPDIDCFAIVRASDLAGFAATREDELLHFGTAVETWGSGLAARAHDQLLSHLAGCGHDTAWLKVFEENHRAVRFYRRRGWTATDERWRTSFAPYPMLRRFEISLPG